MEDSKNQLSDRLKSANNVLVTVNSNPTVDQLAAAIGLTLMLIKLGKHATAVFSGQVPSTIEFLKPEKTLEKNADSLRDFIISLDKSKADKLRYKIEENYVKIFITPYHTSLSDKDLIFSQGDYNVDVIVGLGVHQREELDKSITAHGRILHDATTTTINTELASTLGSINWSERSSSSLCEMLVTLADMLQPSNLIDVQIANALLTGIVAETLRFSNPKTTANTMNAGSKLLAAGANQQLVAEKLQPAPMRPPEQDLKPIPPVPPKQEVPPQIIPKTEPVVKQPPAEQATQATGLLQVAHEPPKKASGPMPAVLESEPNSGLAQVNIDEQGNLKTIDDQKAPSASINLNGQSVLVSAPADAPKGVQGEGGQINSVGEPDEPPDVDPLDDHSHDEMSHEPEPTPLLTHEEPKGDNTNSPTNQPLPGPQANPTPPPPDNHNLDAYRNAVDEAIASHPDPEHLGAREDLNAQSPLDVNHNDQTGQSQPPNAATMPPPPPVPPPLPNLPVNSNNGAASPDPL